MKRQNYIPGDVLCDMHDGLKFLPDNLAVVGSITVSLEGAGDIARDMVLAAKGQAGYTNKMLVVIGGSPSYNIVAAYAYDDARLGMIELAYK